MKKALFTLSLLAGVALFAYVISQFGGLASARQTLSQTGWIALLAYFANASLMLIAPTAAWMILMRGEGLQVSYWTLFKANLMGGTLNLITPSLYLGGEPLKMAYVARALEQPQRRILATIIVAKFQEAGALLLVMIGALGVALWQLELPAHQQTWLVGSLSVVVLLFGLTVYAFIRNWHPLAKLIEVAARLGCSRRRMARLRSKTREMENLIHQTFTQRWKVFAVAQVIVLFSAGSILMRAWVFFAFTGLFLGGDSLCGLYVITNVANSLPMPGGVGVFEGGMALFGTSVGLPESGLAAFLIVNRTTEVLLALIGLYVMIHLGVHSMTRSYMR